MSKSGALEFSALNNIDPIWFTAVGVTFGSFKEMATARFSYPSAFPVRRQETTFRD